MGLYTFDIECFGNFFFILFKNYKTKNFISFEISDRIDETTELLDFIRKNQQSQFCGFNIVNYDYPLLHNTILTGKRLNPYQIKSISDDIISNEKSAIKPNLVKLKLIDLFKVWHYDNKNKSTSLKWLEFAMRMDSVEDLPYPHYKNLSSDEMDRVIEYCHHDVNATELFLSKSLKQLTLRKEYTAIENEYMMNYSEIAISKAVFGKALAKEMGISRFELNGLRTPRTEVKIEEIIFDYIKFNDPINQKALNLFKSKVWRYDKDQEKALESIKFTIPYKNVIREFAEGGLHSFGKPGIYETNDDWILIDVDYASYYPHITFKNKLHPEHIPEALFNKIYEGFYIDRKKYSKKDVRNYVLKIILNGSYGLSKDKYSFLYDPKWQLQICINGQLILAMLTERIFEKCIHQPTIIFENTDGAMYRIHRSDLDLLKDACDEIAAIVNIPLETQECKKIIIRDVNNYINVINDNDIKFKGCFEIDRDFHKNHSKRIVPLSLANYFINGVLPEETIKGHLYNNDVVKVIKDYDKESKKVTYYKAYGLFDYLIGSKMTGKNVLHEREKFDLKKISNLTDSEVETLINILKSGMDRDAINNYLLEGITDNRSLLETFLRNNKYYLDKPLSKTNRYVVVNEGIELIKKLPPLEKSFMTSTDKHKTKVNPFQMNLFDDSGLEDVKIDPEDRESNLEVGFKCQVLNVINDSITNGIRDNINHDYYIAECYKIINKINEKA